MSTNQMPGQINIEPSIPTKSAMTCVRASPGAKCAHTCRRPVQPGTESNRHARELALCQLLKDRLWHGSGDQHEACRCRS